MAARKVHARAGKRSTGVFTKEERAAMREAVRERKSRPPPGSPEAEQEVLEKIAEMEPSDRAMAQRVHAIMKAHAPGLTGRTWYGMPAYEKGDEVVCFFRSAAKFKTRYATLGFSDTAQLDEGRMWATDFALTQLTATEEARIVALVKKAIG